jgi:hypothetical protein
MHAFVDCKMANIFLSYHQLPRPAPPTKWEAFAKQKGEIVILASSLSVLVGSLFTWI